MMDRTALVAVVVVADSMVVVVGCWKLKQRVEPRPLAGARSQRKSQDARPYHFSHSPVEVAVKLMMMMMVIVVVFARIKYNTRESRDYHFQLSP